MSYLDPPVCLDRLNHVVQWCLFTVQFPDDGFSEYSVPTQGPHHVAMMVVRVTIGSSPMLRGVDPYGITLWREAGRA